MRVSFLYIFFLFCWLFFSHTLLCTECPVEHGTSIAPSDSSHVFVSTSQGLLKIDMEECSTETVLDLKDIIAVKSSGSTPFFIHFDKFYTLSSLDSTISCQLPSSAADFTILQDNSFLIALTGSHGIYHCNTDCECSIISSTEPGYSLLEHSLVSETFIYAPISIDGQKGAIFAVSAAGNRIFNMSLTDLYLVSGCLHDFCAASWDIESKSLPFYLLASFVTKHSKIKSNSATLGGYLSSDSLILSFDSAEFSLFYQSDKDIVDFAVVDESLFILTENSVEKIRFNQ